MNIKVKSILLSVLVILTCTPTAANAQALKLDSIQAELYASPSGTGNLCSVSSPCSIEDARNKVRTINQNMTGDIVVYLLDGTYSLTSPLQFRENSSTHDSGTNGYHIIYKANTGANPIISGGQTITGWSLYHSGKNIYRAYVGTGLNTRQLYVNDLRAVRARGAVYPAGWTPVAGGYNLADPSLASWGNPTNIEVINHFLWKNQRCLITSISSTKATIPCTFEQAPTWIENAYELLDEEGEWYLNRSDGYVYYKPRSGENMATAKVIAPTLESLIDGEGTLTQPLKNLVFEGLTFAHATWLQPSTDGHYLTGQAGFYNLPATMKQWWDGETTKTAANVAFHAAYQIRFERNIFTHLGGSGLSFEYGSKNNEIVGNVFTDISGAAVSLGHVNDHHPCGDVATCSSSAINANNTIANNYITRAGVEYFELPSIWVGYTDNTLIEHNEILDSPYTAISVGWGWGEVDPGGAVGYITPTIAKNNKIQYNMIKNPMQVLRDGGAIYTLGAQPNSTINNNYIANYNNDYGAIYLDNGTRYYEVENNVVRGTGQTSRWLFLQDGSLPATDYSVHNNYSDTSRMSCFNLSTSCGGMVTSNVTDGSTPISALNIINNAGLESMYAAIKTPYESTNLALNKTATALYLGGSVARMQPNSLPGYAVDGDAGTFAQATDEWAWQLQVDLGSIKTVDRVVVRMLFTAYATAYDIKTSTDGINFTTVKSVTQTLGRMSEDRFAATSARYVRITAVSPNAAGQTGGQMSINELEIYGS